MTYRKTFTLAEANALLPTIKMILLSANNDLSEKAELLTGAHINHENCERAMSKVKAVRANNEDDKSGLFELRECRLNFQSSIVSLHEAKESYVEAMNFWLEEVSQTGVILRDIKSGLLDFPADSGNFRYYLCWQADEEEIEFWHHINDGFIGRRPLAVLSEYL